MSLSVVQVSKEPAGPPFYVLAARAPSGSAVPRHLSHVTPSHLCALVTWWLIICPSGRTVPLFVPDLPALYGLFRAKKIKNNFQR